MSTENTKIVLDLQSDLILNNATINAPVGIEVVDIDGLDENLLNLSSSINNELELRIAGDNSLEVYISESVSQFYGNQHIFTDNETPLGVIDESNKVFSLQTTPILGSEHVHLNGMLQLKGEGLDFTITGTDITFSEPPYIGDIIKVSYRSDNHPSLHFIDHEVPSGEIDGNNKIYTLYATPYENADHVYLNGLLQTRGNGNDYVLVEKTITFNKVPKIGSTIQVSYRY